MFLTIKTNRFFYLKSDSLSPSRQKKVFVYAGWTLFIQTLLYRGGHFYNMAASHVPSIAEQDKRHYQR